MLKLAPSILSADFACLLSDIKSSAAARTISHVDVMDGHFVPNISFGAPVMKALNDRTKLPYDVHLMIENPDQYLDSFVTPQTAFITVHREACVHLHRTIQKHPREGDQGRRCHQSGDACIKSGMHLGGCGSCAGDVGQSGLRRTKIYSVGLGEGQNTCGNQARERAFVCH